MECELSEVEAGSDKKRYGEAWKIMSEISGRRKSKASQVRCPTPEERVKTWFTHFKNLLGDPPTVADEDEDIQTVLMDIDIDDGPFKNGRAQES